MNNQMLQKYNVLNYKLLNIHNYTYTCFKCTDRAIDHAVCCKEN